MSHRKFDMDDSLGKFIAGHREAFDDELPSPQLWAGIVDELETKDAVVRRMPSRWMMATAAVTLLLLGVGLGTLLNRPAANSNLYAEQAGLGELEEYYADEIDELVVKLVGAPDFDAVESELSMIDADIEQLKVDLQHVPLKTKEQVLQSIIAAYENKVMMLETVLDHTQPIKKLHHEESLEL